MPLPNPWLLVFDLDGTLIDSSLDLCLSVNAALAHVGAPGLQHDVITSHIGDGAAMLVRRALESSGAYGTGGPGSYDVLLEQALAYFLDFYRHHKLDHTRPYAGVEPALRRIRQCRPDLPMAVLTNKPVNPSRAICEALGLAPYFFANYGGNSFPTKKPDPAGLRTLMEEASDLWRKRGVHAEALQPSGVVMIGDSDADVLTAQRAGTQSLGCRYGLAPDRLELAGPDLMCDEPGQWPTLLHLCD